jgi:leader peptidase (prepilin peptidase)/N-methyltransferase
MKIPWRYPLIELVVATGMLILFSRSGATGEFILKAAVFLLMTLISLIDWDFQLIPNRVLVVGGIFGIALKGLVNLPALPESIVSAFLSFGVIFSLRFLANLLLRRDSLGMGDVKLAFLLGLFLGFRLFLVAFWAASILGAIYGLTRRKSHRSDPLPFGSFLALTSILAFTFDEESLRVLSLWS